MSLNNYLHILLAVLGFCCGEGFSLVVASRSYSLGVEHRLRIAVASCAVRALDRSLTWSGGRMLLKLLRASAVASAGVRQAALWLFSR